MLKKYYFFICMVAICLLVAVIFSFADENLVFNSTQSHQVWRLLTAHIVHTDAYHLIGNLLAFALLIYIFPLTWQSQIKVFIVAIVLIDLYLLLFSIDVYAGISGLIYAIPGTKFFQLLKQKKFIPALLIISILILYVFIISPQTNGIRTTIWEPLKGAHFLGFLAGFWSLKTARK